MTNVRDENGRARGALTATLAVVAGCLWTANPDFDRSIETGDAPLGTSSDAHTSAMADSTTTDETSAGATSTEEPSADATSTDETGTDETSTGATGMTRECEVRPLSDGFPAPQAHYVTLDGLTVPDLVASLPGLDLRVPGPPLPVETPAGIGFVGSGAQADSVSALLQRITETDAVTISLHAGFALAQPPVEFDPRIFSLSTGTDFQRLALLGYRDPYELAVRFNGSGNVWLSLPPRFEAHNFHFAFVGQPGQYSFYVDGNLVMTTPSSSGVSDWMSDMSLTFANEATFDRPWHGNIREMLIFAAPLSEAQIQGLAARSPCE